MLIKLFIYGPIVYIFVGICYRAISNKASTVPFSLNHAPTNITEFSISLKFLGKEVTFILTVGLFVNHFALDSQVVLVLPLKNIPIIVFDHHLPMKFVILPFAFFDLGPRNYSFEQTFHFIG